MKTIRLKEVKWGTIWENIVAVFVIALLIILGGLMFYGMAEDYSGNTKYAWIPTLAWAIFVIGILIYDHYHPDGGLL
ncbi:MAG TPA: hypothetical protein VI911_05945 [Patescibacteria group bacterium]|nr:hypothetical protein [Patescibacteria group bacterium]